MEAEGAAPDGLTNCPNRPRSSMAIGVRSFNDLILVPTTLLGRCPFSTKWGNASKVLAAHRHLVRLGFIDDLDD